MNEPPFDLQRANRWFAVECNNRAWDLLEKVDRTAKESHEMIDLAHAARWHWSHVGTEANDQRALVLLAKVHADAGHGSVAVQYALLCNDVTATHSDQLTEFDLACAAECLARSHAAAGDLERAREFKQRASSLGAAIPSDDDRGVFEQLLGSGNWHGLS